MGAKLSVGAGPHIRNRVTTDMIMVDFIVSLLPIIMAGMIAFDGKFLILLIFSIASAVTVDYVVSKIMKIEGKSVYLSSIITAILLILTFPVDIPLWVVFFGISFAIVAGKLIFGGLGQNLFNPALLGRLFLTMSFPQYIFNYRNLDDVSGSTILQLMKNSGSEDFTNVFSFVKKIFLEVNYDNSIGESSVLALFMGFAYLCIKKRIDYRIPLIAMAVVMVGGYFNGNNGIYYMFSGGVVFGFIYFLTDPVTSPYTSSGKVAYAVFTALIAVAIRELSSHPEGVVYAILFGNMCVPLFNKLFTPKVFGRKNNMKELWNLLKIFGFSVGMIFALVLVDKKIGNKIEVQKEKTLLKEMKELVPEGEKFDLYENSAYYKDYLFIPVYNAQNVKIAYIVKGRSKGYSDKELEFLLGIDMEGKTTGHKIIAHKETLGLGSKIAGKEYKELWIGKDMNTKFDKSTDAPAGATYTFLNFFKTVQEVLSIYNEKILTKKIKIKKETKKIKLNDIKKIKETNEEENTDKQEIVKEEIEGDKKVEAEEEEAKGVNDGGGVAAGAAAE